MNRLTQLNKPLTAALAHQSAKRPLRHNPVDVNSGPVRLGESVRQLFEGRLQDRLITSQVLNEVWNHILPKELEGHCSIEQIKDGLLKVQADLPCYAYQFRLHGDNILKSLQESCPGAKIKKIKVLIRPAAQA